MPVIQELIIEKSREELTMDDLSTLARMSDKQLGEVAELALRQEPPNTEIAALAGGICTSRFFAENWTHFEKRDALLPGIQNAFPAVEESVDIYRSMRRPI
jgi:hypothetical protein